METMALRIVSLSAMKVYNYASMVRAELLKSLLDVEKENHNWINWS